MNCEQIVALIREHRDRAVWANREDVIRNALELAACCRQQAEWSLANWLIENASKLPLGQTARYHDELRRQSAMIDSRDTSQVQIAWDAGFTEASVTEVSKVEKEFPSLLIRGVNFTTAMARYAASGFKRRTPDEVSERLAICQGCPHFQNDHCSICGCPCVEDNKLTNKLALASERCPIGKWK